MVCILKDLITRNTYCVYGREVKITSTNIKCYTCNLKTTLSLLVRNKLKLILKHGDELKF